MARSDELARSEAAGNTIPLSYPRQLSFFKGFLKLSIGTPQALEHWQHRTYHKATWGSVGGRQTAKSGFDGMQSIRGG